MTKILKWATEEVDNPDLRDRGFIYWRLLSTNPAMAKVNGIRVLITSRLLTMSEEYYLVREARNFA
jgi:vesicle coat complex subunit